MLVEVLTMILPQALIVKPTRLWLLARSVTQHGGYVTWVACC